MQCNQSMRRRSAQPRTVLPACEPLPHDRLAERCSTCAGRSGFLRADAAIAAAAIAAVAVAGGAGCQRRSGAAVSRGRRRRPAGGGLGRRQRHVRQAAEGAGEVGACVLHYLRP